MFPLLHGWRLRFRACTWATTAEKRRSPKQTPAMLKCTDRGARGSRNEFEEGNTPTDTRSGKDRTEAGNPATERLPALPVSQTGDQADNFGAAIQNESDAW